LTLLLIGTVQAQNQTSGGAFVPPPPDNEQALPKALYIVPWKDADIGGPLPTPRVNVDAVLTPLSRDTFRQMYLGRLQFQSGASGAVSGEK
jgi:hypothetical protein